MKRCSLIAVMLCFEAWRNFFEWKEKVLCTLWTPFWTQQVQVRGEIAPAAVLQLIHSLSWSRSLNTLRDRESCSGTQEEFRVELLLFHIWTNVPEQLVCGVKDYRLQRIRGWNPAKRWQWTCTNKVDEWVRWRKFASQSKFSQSSTDTRCESLEPVWQMISSVSV